MNEDEKEMLKVGAEAAIKPFAELMQKLFGGAVEEIGGGWQDRLAIRRKIRQIKLFTKLQSEIDKAGLEPRKIPDNIWIPALTEALQQDDETLEDKWAKLLAKAADPKEEMIPQSFPRILAELSPRQARDLDRIHDQEAEQRKRNRWGTNEFTWDKLFKACEAEYSIETEFDIDLDNLIRLRLIQEAAPYIDRDKLMEGGRIREDMDYRITSLGTAFVSACRGPAAQKG